MKDRKITTNQDIEYLIQCHKRFKSKPRKPVNVNRNVTQKFSVFGVENGAEFNVFFSYSECFPNDFSLGLMFGNMLLLRCNGFHGTTRSGFFSAAHHAYPHLHKLTLSDIENGRERKPSKIEDLTGKYVDFRTASLFFFEECGIINYETYFPTVSQMKLFDI